MSTEKAEAIVIRQADFSESSRVVTFFSKEFGKFAALAKGAKRLRGPFDAALDLLSQCRVVFIRKSSGSLSLLTEARLVSRFRPESPDLARLYGGYYLAELLSSLTEDFDPAPTLFELSVAGLNALAASDSPPAGIVVQLEVLLLREVGLLPNLFECSVCGDPVTDATQDARGQYAHWVSQGGLLCQKCRREEFAGTSISVAAIEVLKQLSLSETDLSVRIEMNSGHISECHRFAVSAITQAIGRKPATLRYLQF